MRGTPERLPRGCGRDSIGLDDAALQVARFYGVRVNRDALKLQEPLSGKVSSAVAVAVAVRLG